MTRRPVVILHYTAFGFYMQASHVYPPLPLIIITETRISFCASNLLFKARSTILYRFPVYPTR